jgi:hypothetical protein
VEVVVDGRRGWGAGDGRTLGAIWDAVEASLGRKKIILMVLDGEELTRERRQELRGRNAGDFSLLEVKTVDPVDFGREALKGISAHLENLDRAHCEAARLLEAAEYGRATERLWECYNGWDTLSRAVRDVAVMAGVSLAKVPARGTTGSELIGRLNQTLARFRSAMDFPDIVRLSRLATHDLRPELAAWRTLVDKLARDLEAGAK